MPKQPDGKFRFDYLDHNGKRYVLAKDLAEFFDYMALKNPSFALAFLALREDIRTKVLKEA